MSTVRAHWRLMDNELLDRQLDVERHDVFDVMQLTRDTALANEVGVDLVEVDPGQESSMHRHNHAETVLYFTGGAGEVLLGAEREAHPVVAGDRLRIGKGVFHAVRTNDSALTFVSVQTPPILDIVAGTRDLEPIEAVQGSDDHARD